MNTPYIHVNCHHCANPLKVDLRLERNNAITGYCPHCQVPIHLVRSINQQMSPSYNHGLRRSFASKSQNLHASRKIHVMRTDDLSWQ